MKKNKNRIIYLLVIMIVILLTIGIVSYIKFENSKSNDRYQILDIDSEMVKDLFYLTKGRSGNNLFLGSEYENLYYKNEKIDLNEMDENFKRVLAYYNLDRNSFKYQDNLIIINAEEIKKQYINIFGTSDDYVDGTIYCFSTITYDSENNQYVISGGKGGEILTGYQNKIIEARQYKDKVEIYEKVLFYRRNASYLISNVYSDSKYSNKLDIEIIEPNYVLENHSDLLDTYKYTFVKNGNDYIFNKVEKVMEDK